MKSIKKILSVILCAAAVAVLFCGCSQSGKNAAEITDKTMIIAYTEENSPFLYKNENGEMAGFEAELIENVFDSIKGEYTDYAFVQVDKNHKLNEDICYTDESGKGYTAKILCGGMHKNEGTVNEDYCWSTNLIANNIITVVPAAGSFENYNSLAGLKAGAVSGSAMDALNRNAAVKNSLSAVTEYKTAAELLTALDNGVIDAAVIEDFDFYTSDAKDKYKALSGVLDTEEYGFCFARNADYSYSFNEAVREMQSADYGNGDTLAPLVEKHFGYKDACVFDYKTDGDK